MFRPLLIPEDAQDNLSGVDIEFSAADGNIDEAEEEDTETEQTDTSQQRTEAVSGMDTI
jgi:hypothetical protein